MATGIPTGTVAFFFSDVEQSTRLWEDHPKQMERALQRHDHIVRDSIESNDGYVFSLAGDQFVAAFHRVADALSAAQACQAAIQAEPWPENTPIRVRIGIHVGAADERDNDYFGQVLNRTARIVSAGHGGQTLLSGTAAELARGVELTDLGEHRLKDLAEAEHLWQVGNETHRPLRTLQNARHNLGVERTPLVGRSDDVAEISKAVLDHRLVTLLGIGGTGKTRLASAVGAELADRFVDGVWFVDLVPVNNANGIAEAIASAAGLQLSGSDLVEALVGQADTREFLLIIDNCEHLTDQAADVIDLLLERTRKVHILATSREPLDLPDERQVRVTPLAVKADAASPAVRLFIDGASRIGTDVAVDDIALVATVCERLDGLPLSIELAAAQLRQLTLPELADRLDERFQLLTRSRSNRRRRRQSSLLDVLDDSWNMLDDHERGLLARLAAFPASFELIDVEGLTGDRRNTSRLLGGLVDRGLVAGNGRSGNRLLETVKLFVRDRWADHPEVDFAEQHTNWVLTYLREHGADNNHQSIPLAGWAIRHYDDHRVVEDRLVATGRFDEVAELLRHLRWAYSRETAQRASALIERIERYLADLDLTDWQSGSLHLVAGRAARASRDADWVRRGGTEAVRLFRPSGPTSELATALIVSTFSEIVRDPASAFQMLDEADEIARAIDDDLLAAATLGYRANYTAMALRFDDLEPMLDALAPRLADGVEDNTLVMALEATLIANLLADPPVARAAIERCVEVTAAHGLDHDWFMMLHLAIALAATGDVDATVRCLDDVDELLEQSGIDGLPDRLLPYASLAHALGDDDRCRLLLTAIRNGDGLLGTGFTIAAYRLHRSAVGLLADDPLNGTTMSALLDDVRAWVSGLLSEALSEALA